MSQAFFGISLPEGGEAFIENSAVERTLEKGEREFLGGDFGPEKIPRKHPPSLPPPPPPGRPPPLLRFSIKNRPPPSWRLGLHRPLPRAEKKKIS